MPEIKYSVSASARVVCSGMKIKLILIIIAFKGAIGDFFTISLQCRKVSPTRTLKWPGYNRVQVTCNTSRVYHVQVSCYVPRGAKGQLSY